jgi:hypothetical protein
MLALAALLVAGQASAQDALTGVARSVSLVNAIYNCGRYYPVDAALLERFDRAFNAVGEKAAARVVSTRLARGPPIANLRGPLLWITHPHITAHIRSISAHAPAGRCPTSAGERSQRRSLTAHRFHTSPQRHGGRRGTRLRWPAFDS